MIRIREIIRKMEQGVTEAVLCRADDGTQYVVKSRTAGREAMIREWLCYRIGTSLGLPIPVATMVHMDAAGARYSFFPEVAALGECPGFGSKLVEPADLLTPANIEAVPAELRTMVLLFDWWVINGDRQDGNTNLLWLEHSRSLHVIDHNLAFGNDAPEEFWQYHIFRADRPALAGLKEQKLPAMQRIIDELPLIWAELPAEWTDVCIIELNQVDKILRRCLADDFWM